MLVRRIARPIPARGVHLNHHQFVRGEVRANDVHDLTGSVSTATQTGGHVAWGHQPWLKFCLRRNAAFRNLAGSFRLELHGMAGGQVESVRKSIKNIFPAADRLLSLAPVRDAAAAENHKGS